MKDWIWLLIIVALLVVAGATARYWFSPLLNFSEAEKDKIQSVTALVQMFLWIGSGISIIIGLIIRKKKSNKIAPQDKNGAERVIGDRSVSIEGNAKENIIITGDKSKVIIDKKKSADRSAFRKGYLNHTFTTARYLSLTGIDPKAASEAETRLELNAIYTALFTMSTEAHEKWLHGKTAETETQRLTALEQLNRHKHLVLLGDPGSGKSTFVNFVTLCLSGESIGRKDENLKLLTAPAPVEDKDEEKAQKWDHGALIPVRVILRDFAARGLPSVGEEAKACHLWDFIAAELDDATLGDYTDHLHTTLLEDGGLLLLDGLDEVPEADMRRTQIKQSVEDFSAAFPLCRILVTSRTYAYQKQDWRLPDFSETVLAPFNKTQIRRFIDRWYSYIGVLRGLHADDAQGRAELLKNAISNSDRLGSLAERPLLLTLMASLHAWRGGSLPEQREELYSDTVDLLLDWWESPKTVRDAKGKVKVLQPSLAEWLEVDRKKVRDLLNELAFKAHESQPDLAGTADIPENDLVDGFMNMSESRNPDVKPARLIEYISQRAGLLIPRGVGVYTFPHRTFQEYLAACFLTDSDFPDRLAELVCDDPNRWRETALLAGAKAVRGAASTIWLLVEALCYKAWKSGSIDMRDVWGAHLAGQVVVESADLTKLSERNREKVDRIKDWLVNIIQTEKFPATERDIAGDTLARLGDKRPEVMTLKEMQFCFVPHGSFWMGSDEYEWEKPQQINEKIDYRYWISRFPVTNAQFALFVESGGYEESKYWSEAKKASVWENGKVKGRWDDNPRNAPYDFGNPYDLSNHPVVGITWYEALAFNRWLNDYLHEEGFLSKEWTVRLPYETEWEKAARGGLQIPKIILIKPIHGIEQKSNSPLIDNPDPKRRYPWGKDPDVNRANYDETGIGHTSTVGCFPGGVSPYGCEEMSGNVWEWCGTKWREDYTKVAVEDPEGDDPRVIRGGSYVSAEGRALFRLVRSVLRVRSCGFSRIVVPTSLNSVISGLRISDRWEFYVVRSEKWQRKKWSYSRGRLIS